MKKYMPLVNEIEFAQSLPAYELNIQTIDHPHRKKRR